MEGSEGELALCAGDYLLVWGNGEPQGGYLDAELLDGRRGLVPASFVQRLVGEYISYSAKALTFVIKIIDKQKSTTKVLVDIYFLLSIHHEYLLSSFFYPNLLIE